MSYLPYVQKKNYGVNFQNGKDWIPIVALDTIIPSSLVISYSKYASLSVIIERDNFTKLKLRKEMSNLTGQYQGPRYMFFLVNSPQQLKYVRVT